MTNPATTLPPRRALRIAYWTVTLLLCLNLLAGILDLLVLDTIRQSTQGVGFPLTILPLLGSLKIAGALVLLLVKNPILKIATYAGVIYYFVGAIFAHLSVGQPIGAALPAGFTLALATGSYLLWQRVANVQIRSTP